MNELERLRAAMVAFPCEATPKMMYVDELMEQSGCSLEAAYMDADGHWRPAMNAWQIREACRIIQGSGPLARRLQVALNRHLPNPTPMQTHVLVTSGSVAPMMDDDQAAWRAGCERCPTDTAIIIDEELHRAWRVPSPYVLVGAAWILREAAKWQSIYNAVTPEPNDKLEE